MSETAMAFIVFGALFAGALTLFVLERRAVAKRKANGTYVDVSDFLFFGTDAALKRRAESQEK